MVTGLNRLKKNKSSIFTITLALFGIIMTALNSSIKPFVSSVASDSLPSLRTANQQHIRHLQTANQATTQEQQLVLMRGEDETLIKFDFLLSFSSHSLFHPSSLLFDLPQAAGWENVEMALPSKCAFVDDDDLALINSVLKEQKGDNASPTTARLEEKTIRTYDVDVEKTYVKKIILSNRPVGNGLESDLEDLLHLEPVFTYPDSLIIRMLAEMCSATDNEGVVTEALKILSVDYRRLMAAMDVERVVSHDQTIRYQKPIVQEADRRRQEILRGSFEEEVIMPVNQYRKRRKREGGHRESWKKSVRTLEQGRLGHASNVVHFMQPPKGLRGRTPTLAQILLKKWLFSNRYHPYPTEAEKESLCKKTGMCMKQLNNWFINARRRILPSYLEESP